MANYLKTHQELGYHCQICGKGFRSRVKLRKHQDTYHMQTASCANPLIGQNTGTNATKLEYCLKNMVEVNINEAMESFWGLSTSDVPSPTLGQIYFLMKIREYRLFLTNYGNFSKKWYSLHVRIHWLCWMHGEIRYTTPNLYKCSTWTIEEAVVVFAASTSRREVDHIAVQVLPKVPFCFARLQEPFIIQTLDARVPFCHHFQ